MTFLYHLFALVGICFLSFWVVWGLAKVLTEDLKDDVTEAQKQIELIWPRLEQLEKTRNWRTYRKGKSHE